MYCDNFPVKRVEITGARQYHSDEKETKNYDSNTLTGLLAEDSGVGCSM